jgi:radical SAM protein with 4Fe4S-binding SPASM domain
MLFKPLKLYAYLIGTYSKFVTTGKCLDFPLVVQLQTQSRCNGGCLICPYRIVSKTLEHGRMSQDLFIKIADELADESLTSIVLFELHNEPLMDKRTFQWVNHIKSTRPHTFCEVVTNGELLDRFTPEEIVQSGLDQLCISLNAYSKGIYDQITDNRLNFERVMKNISTMLTNEHIKRRLELDFIMTELNKHELHRAAQYWEKRQVRTRVKGFYNRAGILDNFEDLRLQSRYYGEFPFSVKNRLATALRRAIGCELPFSQMTVLFNGDVIICCQDWNRTTVVGNIWSNSIKEIWNSERMNKIRREITRGEYGNISACKDCSFTRQAVF